ncbi:DUF429 domain-containing protein [Humisphaera borealis]|uniref:DUF429 domain-containing protein n=1 Tax=Humisphaera borealis TaxID=2807512 RepID=A0A7M2WS65_9BACT|nr:DUF429 domain-containing protein [Humisphaera borealis]QOV88249.1 DUF429 domain-containing protein [Humisphaera borealis]
MDFSGAKLAGRNIWLAVAEPLIGLDVAPGVPKLRLKSLDRLEDLCGTAERAPALAYLVERVRSADSMLTAADFPFGLPIEVVPDCVDWPGQLADLGAWPGDANALGTECVRRARRLGDKMHIRRTTDTDSKTPFDCYHYRIIYQTFHGMRDVLLPLSAEERVAILPFQYSRLKRAANVVVEACPSSTLKRLGLPHQNYKQPTGGPLTAKRRRTRLAILAGLRTLIEMGDRQVRSTMRNPGADALDAVIAAVGGWFGWRTADHKAIAAHARYGLEGYVYF